MESTTNSTRVQAPTHYSLDNLANNDISSPNPPGRDEIDDSPVGRRKISKIRKKSQSLFAFHHIMFGP